MKNDTQDRLADYIKLINGSRVQSDSRQQQHSDNSIASTNEVKHMNGMDKFQANVFKQTEALAYLLIKKQLDYGPKNIALAPGGPLNGLRVRMFDKISRINHLIDTGATPENESLRDSFMDLANYGIIAMMVLDGQWEGTDNG
jgi:hypothetical protein